MGHRHRVRISWQPTIDRACPARLAAFWREVLGYVEAPVPEGHDSWTSWLQAHAVPPEGWDDAPYLVDPEGNELCVV